MGYLEEAKYNNFLGQKETVKLIIDFILCEVKSWFMMNREFKNLFLNFFFIMEWVSCLYSSPYNDGPIEKGWEAPSERKMKLNFDDSPLGNPMPGLFWVCH